MDEEKTRIRPRRGASWPRPKQHFAAQGLAGARTEEIATAAHANKAMLYYYFGDKRHLHRAVLENLFRQLRNGVYQPQRKQHLRRANDCANSSRLISIFSLRIRIIRAWCSAKPWNQRRNLTGSCARVSAAVSQPIGAHAGRRNRGGRISRRGSASHGVHDHGHDDFLFRGCADFQPGGRTQSSGAARASGAQTGVAGFSGSWIDSNKSEEPDDRPKICDVPAGNFHDRGGGLLLHDATRQRIFR